MFQLLVTCIRDILPAKLTREHLAKEKGLADVCRCPDLLQFAYWCEPMPVKSAVMERTPIQDSQFSFNGLLLHPLCLNVCVEDLRPSKDVNWSLSVTGINAPKGLLRKPVEKPHYSGIKYGKGSLVTAPNGTILE
ncbi:hypothetical protein HDU82_005590 [Entophlyctis luteolus]|nr:hypothetical protein HDU82_005590 [Entophlyctis luteolus]